jgi:SAM-dependent methyltransferase
MIEQKQINIKTENKNRNYGSQKFQSLLLNTSIRSAEEIVPCLMELIAPKSVVDIGCGVGAWLSVFRDKGKVTDYLGFDGEYMLNQNLQISPQFFVTCNLDKMIISCDRTFDMVISLEVAEHLTKENALPFIQHLTNLAPVVCFSAAIPKQGGTNHINEQWPDYWANLFAQRKFVPIDCIRKKFWNNEKVAWWYKQNTILYVREDCLDQYPQICNYYDGQPPIPIVHPQLYKKYTERTIFNKIKKFFQKMLSK